MIVYPTSVHELFHKDMHTHRGYDPMRVSKLGIIELSRKASGLFSTSPCDW